jgi:hypothetical protein
MMADEYGFKEGSWLCGQHGDRRLIHMGRVLAYWELTLELPPRRRVARVILRVGMEEYGPGLEVSLMGGLKVGEEREGRTGIGRTSL